MKNKQILTILALSLIGGSAQGMWQHTANVVNTAKNRALVAISAVAVASSAAAYHGHTVSQEQQKLLAQLRAEKIAAQHAAAMAPIRTLQTQAQDTTNKLNQNIQDTILKAQLDPQHPFAQTQIIELIPTLFGYSFKFKSKGNLSFLGKSGMFSKSTDVPNVSQGNYVYLPNFAVRTKNGSYKQVGALVVGTKNPNIASLLAQEEAQKALEQKGAFVIDHAQFKAIHENQSNESFIEQFESNRKLLAATAKATK